MDAQGDWIVFNAHHMVGIGSWLVYGASVCRACSGYHAPPKKHPFIEYCPVQGKVLQKTCGFSMHEPHECQSPLFWGRCLCQCSVGLAAGDYTDS